MKTGGVGRTVSVTDTTAGGPGQRRDGDGAVVRIGSENTDNRRAHLHGQDTGRNESTLQRKNPVAAVGGRGGGALDACRAAEGEVLRGRVIVGAEGIVKGKCLRSDADRADVKRHRDWGIAGGSAGGSAGDDDIGVVGSRREPGGIGGYREGGGSGAADAQGYPIHCEPGRIWVREREVDGRPCTAGHIDRLGNDGATHLTGKGQGGLIHYHRLCAQALCENQHEQRQNQGGNRKNSLQGRTSKRAGSSDERTPRRKTYPARRVPLGVSSQKHNELKMFSIQ